MCTSGCSKSWLAMMFLGYAFLFTVRLHFMYAMVSLMANAKSSPEGSGTCEDVGRPEINATTYTAAADTRRPPTWTPRQQTAMAGAYFLGTLSSAFPGGVYANRGHERSMMLSCVAITAVTLPLMPVASGYLGSWIAVMMLRFVQGCAFGPTGSCGGTLTKKIVPKSVRSTYSTFMFSGTVFGSFLGNLYSGTVMTRVSHDGSYFVLSAVGLVWAVTWTVMIHMTPYERDDDGGDPSQGSAHSMRFSSTPWSVILGSKPFVGLLIASCGYGHLYSFLATAMPAYRASVLGGDFVENGAQVSVPWLTCWVTCVLAGVSAVALSDSGAAQRTTIIKLYAGLVLVASPLTLLGVVIAGCDRSSAGIFMYVSVVLFGFERSSIRINSLDLCSRYAGSLIALCDVFNSIGNISNLVISRILFTDTVNWDVSFMVSIAFPIVCSIPFILFASSKNQCWDQRYVRPTIL